MIVRNPFFVDRAIKPFPLQPRTFDGRTGIHLQSSYLTTWNVYHNHPTHLQTFFRSRSNNVGNDPGLQIISKKRLFIANIKSTVDLVLRFRGNRLIKRSAPHSVINQASPTLPASSINDSRKRTIKPT